MRAISFLALLGAANLGFGQIKVPGVNIPGLDSDPFKKEPITTSLKDAKWEAPDKDGWNPPDPARSLLTLERTSTGGFVLQPGYFTLTVQSYCLHAGTHGPGGGDGYLYAPLKGPAEELCRDIVRNSVQHPEIEQHDIQALIWAILASAKFDTLQDNLKGVAAKLLTPKQLLTMNRSGLDLLSDDGIAGRFIKQPPIVRQVLEAQAKLRNAFANPASNFGDLERLAVLAGEAPIGPGSKQVPAGRWSNRPEGYMIRFYPSGYSTTKVEIYVPEGSSAVGKEFDPSTTVAVPGNTARQRLLQSGREKVQHN
jgi:hypothetical protein